MSQPDVNVSNTNNSLVIGSEETITQAENALTVHKNHSKQADLTLNHRNSTDRASPGSASTESKVVSQVDLALPPVHEQGDSGGIPVETSLQTGIPHISCADSGEEGAAGSSSDSRSAFPSLGEVITDTFSPMTPAIGNGRLTDCDEIVEIKEGKNPPEYILLTSPRFIDKGSIMQVEPDSGHLGGSIVIVLAISSDNRLQCLRLCRHREKQGRPGENAFWQTHSYIFDPKQNAIKGFADTLGQRPHQSIKADLHDEFELLPKCFINYEHTWTAGGPHAKLREVGTLAEEELSLVMNSYRKTLEKMYDWPDSHRDTH